MLSVYSLPDVKEQRKNIYKLLLKYKKSFTLYLYLKKEDIEVIEDLFIFNNFLQQKNFYRFEKQFINKEWVFIN